MRQLQYLIGVGVLAAAIASPAMAACIAPGPAPVVPDGNTTTADQLKTVHAQVQTYVDVLQKYQDCLEAQIKSAPGGTKAGDLQKMRDAGNAAIDQANALSASYSEQVKVFRARAQTK